MRLALIEYIDDGRGQFSTTKLEYDLVTYKERLANIAYEYYLGNKSKIKTTRKRIEYFRYETIVDEESVKSILKESFEYAFNTLENEIKKQSVKII